MKFEFLSKIREHELQVALQLMPQGGSILEIGAGAGWQAKKLSARGFLVKAIDLADSNYAEQSVWPVNIYDGKNIPYDDNSFDVVFSSNVMEHIPWVREFQLEIQRVLKPDGLAIHIIPTGSWRFWTNLTYYIFTLINAPVVLIRKVFEKTTVSDSSLEPSWPKSASNKSRFFGRLVRLLYPSGHGATGNCLSQIYTFSRFYWVRFFKSTGWAVERFEPMRLFYTGYLLTGSVFNLKFRSFLSYFLGSACRIYILKKTRINSNLTGE